MLGVHALACFSGSGSLKAGHQTQFVESRSGAPRAGLGPSVAAPFGDGASSGLDHRTFPDPARQTGHAVLLHPAFVPEDSCVRSRAVGRGHRKPVQSKVMVKCHGGMPDFSIASTAVFTVQPQKCTCETSFQQISRKRANFVFGYLRNRQFASFSTHQSQLLDSSGRFQKSFPLVVVTR